MKFIALLFALVVGACAALFIVQTGQFSKPASGASTAQEQSAPAAPDAGPAAAPEASGGEPAAAPAAQPPAGGQHPGDVVASLGRNTRAVAASAAKSPRTVAASLTPKPQAAAASAPTPQPAAPTAAAAQLATRIVAPQGLEGISFGMSAQQISRSFPPAWRRETRDELVLVYYPDNRGGQVRFHFNPQGLNQLELQLRPPPGQTTNQFFQSVKQQYAAVYGGLPGSADAGWTDGQTILRITYGDLVVSVRYTPAN